MSYELLVGLALLGALLLVSVWWLTRRQERRWREFEQRQKDDPSLGIITQWLQDMRGSLDRNANALQQQLQSTHQAIGQRLDKAAEIFGLVSKELGHVQEIGRQIKEFQDFLRSPKLRGNIGEQILRDLLEQILPRSNFRLQHRFSDGHVVDAVISTDKGLIPIDAKFPLENFRLLSSASSETEKRSRLRSFSQDVKKHIDAISKKYIVPHEGTLDFAVMYVPSEAIYYEIVTGDDSLSSYAHDKRVLLVSPNSFYYFLQIILIGLEGQRIEKTAKRILDALGTIRHDSVKVAEGLQVLNSHVTNAKNAMERVNSDFLALTSRIENVKRIGSESVEASERALAESTGKTG